MIHNSEELRELASRRPSIRKFPAIAAIDAFCDIGVESVILSKKLFDNAQKVVVSAATHKDAKDVGRTMSAYVNSSYRDIAGGADAIVDIWRRFFQALAPKAAPAAPQAPEAAEAPGRK